MFFFRSVGSYDTTAVAFSVGSNLKQWKMLKLEVLAVWFGWSEKLLPAIFLAVNFRTTNFSQECEDIVKAY